MICDKCECYRKSITKGSIDMIWSLEGYVYAVLKYVC